MTALRRSLTTAATLIVVVALAAGCGSQTSEPRATDTSPTPSSSSPAAPPTVGTYPAYPETDYDFTLAVSCFCVDAGVPIRVEVRDGKAVAATFVKKGRGHAKGDPAPDYRRITLADIIDAANDTEAAMVKVEWPEGQDYPSSVFVDQDKRMADEEIGYDVSDVVPVPAG